MRVVSKRRAKIPRFYFMGPKILFFRFSTFFFYFLCLLRLFCLFTYTIMCISTLRWVLFRNAILVHSAMSYKHFKVLRNGRVVSALVYESEVAEVMSSAPHSNNLLLHIFLYRIVPNSFFETVKSWKSDFLGSTPLAISDAVRCPMYQSDWNVELKLISHLPKFFFTKF